MKPVDVLSFPFFGGFGFCENAIAPCLPKENPLFLWFAFGKRPENITVCCNRCTQTILPSGANKYLASVTVLGRKRHNDDDDTAV